MTTAQQETFEAFYKDARHGLAVQAYALTGDAQAAQKAVRDAMTIAWHHWRKVSRLDSPEEYVRPLTWTRALRRSQARWWSRAKDLDAEAARTLEVLAGLPVPQRRVLLLSALTSLSLDDMARESAIGRAAVERELQGAIAGFTAGRGIAEHEIQGHLEALGTSLVDIRWPRPSIITRAGSARRRSHTVLGVAAAAIALAISGSVVTDAAGVRPALSTKTILESTDRDRDRSPTDQTEVEALPATALVTTDQVTAAFDGEWAQGQTSNNTTGSGLAIPCQAARFADPAAQGALVRSFSRTEAKGKSTVTQTVESSANERAAREAYRTTTDWYAACTAPRVQLLSTHKVRGEISDGLVFSYRDWAGDSTLMVAVSRTGALTTTTAISTPMRRPPAPKALAVLLRDAVAGLCSLPSGGECPGPGPVALATTAALPAGQNPALLGEVDLPPARGVDLPWAGTDPVAAKRNLAATRCDEADFATRFITRAKTRSFVIPGADLPPEFGLTQTVGAMSVARARAFIDRVRNRVATCATDDLGAEVTEVFGDLSKGRELMVWRLTVEVSDERTVTYLMGLARRGSAVTQVTFIPSGSAIMGSEPFIDLARRAQDRLVRIGPLPD
jgi:DNA-directed RNA polymerase specialized sigma24 family protein